MKELLPFNDFYFRRKKKLHQKLVMSKMNAKKAAKLDMDDRAKILQYFSRPVGAAGDIAGTRKCDC